MTEAVRRIAPRSAVAIADTRLLRAARTDIAPVATTTTSLIERLRSRLLGRPRA